MEPLSLPALREFRTTRKAADWVCKGLSFSLHPFRQTHALNSAESRVLADGARNEGKVKLPYCTTPVFSTLLSKKNWPSQGCGS